MLWKVSSNPLDTHKKSTLHLLQAYCISIVWRCYKYLTLRQENARSTVHYILRGEVTDRTPDPEYLLPDYEAACASFKQPPPPSYQAAVEQPAPPAYPEATAGNPRYGFIITQSVVEPPASENNNTTIRNVNERPQTAQDDEAASIAAAAINEPNPIEHAAESEAVPNQIESDDEAPKKDDGLDTLLVKKETDESAKPKEIAVRDEVADDNKAVAPLKEEKTKEEAQIKRTINLNVS